MTMTTRREHSWHGGPLGTCAGNRACGDWRVKIVAPNADLLCVASVCVAPRPQAARLRLVVGRGVADDALGGAQRVWVT